MKSNSARKLNDQNLRHVNKKKLIQLFVLLVVVRFTLALLGSPRQGNLIILQVEGNLLVLQLPNRDSEHCWWSVLRKDALSPFSCEKRSTSDEMVLYTLIRINTCYMCNLFIQLLNRLNRICLMTSHMTGYIAYHSCVKEGFVLRQCKMYIFLFTKKLYLCH